jgi:putative ABC transport system permease protein
MLKAYLKASLRYLLAHKVVTSIHLAGIAFSLCVFYFSMLYVSFETNYDSSHVKGDRIFRLVTDVKTNSGTNYESASAMTGPLLEKEFPQIESIARIYLDDYIFEIDGKNFGTVPVAYADSSLFNVFTIPLVAGNPETALSGPFNAVISETASKNYFGTTGSVGKIIELNGSLPAVVTGVMKDMPHSSHFRKDVFLSMSTLLDSTRGYFNTDWNRFGFYTYLLLKDKAASKQLEKQAQQFLHQANPEVAASQSFYLEPLPDVYLEGKPRGNRAGSTIHGNKINVYTFAVVAALLLLLACFNFINLTIAFSINRRDEISVRKALGATKRQLVAQFLTDAVVLCGIGFVLALLLTILLLPYFNMLAGKIIVDSIFDEPRLLTALGLISLAAGALSGLYPAFMLSSQSRALPAAKKFSLHALTKPLIVAQFSAAIILVVITLTARNQLTFMQNRELGFKKDHLLVIDFQYDDRIRNHSESVARDMLNIPGVTAASFSAYVPGRPNRKFLIQTNDAFGGEQKFQSDFYFIDENFLNQYGIKIIAGRPFFNNRDANQDAILVNEAMARSLGYDNPNLLIGKKITNIYAKATAAHTIIGVVSDFHFAAFREEIKPLVLQANPISFTLLSLSISTGDIHSTMREIRKKWAKLATGLPFSYFFSDEAYDAQYKSEDRFGKIFFCFSLIAIVISCLGLLGLSIFSNQQRRKEMAIRKVLGASVINVSRLLTENYFRLYCISFLISVPIAWLVVHEWLNSFPYRIAIGYGLFVWAGTLTMMTGLFTIIFQTIRTAVSNPAESLKVKG